MPQDAYVFVDYRWTQPHTRSLQTLLNPDAARRVCTNGDTPESESPQEVVDWLLTVAHEVLDGSEHCTGFT